MQQTPNWQALGFVRAFLACVVVGTHLATFSVKSSEWVRVAYALGGKAAVIGFLLISGYSIAASLEAAPSGYFRRRLLRIYPLYLAAIVMTIGVELATGGLVVTPRLTLHAAEWLTRAGNALLLQTFLVKTMTFNGPIWSLSIEVFFYALAPLFIRLPRHAVVGLLLFSLTCFVLPIHEDWGPVYYFLCKFNALRYMWCWLLGFLLWHDRSWALAVFAVAAGGVTLVHEHTREPLSILTYLIAIGSILMASKIKLFKTPSRVAEYFGDLSYPLYLFHYPVFVFAWTRGMGSGTMAIVALGVAMTAHHVIDRHIKPRYLAPLLLPRSTAGA